MRLYALDDRGSWGRALASEAKLRGWECELFRRADEVRQCDYAFMRIEQKPPRHAFDKGQADVLAARGVRLIPDLEQIRLYDDKLGQSRWPPMRPFMPRTLVIEHEDDAAAAATILGFPMLSKTAQGSASKDVRMIHTGRELAAEAETAFSIGIRARYVTQRRYLILQEFLPGNAYDYRVCRIGRRMMMLRRHNRSAAQPFASGSGKCEPIRALDEETTAVAARANEFFDAVRTHWCGIDLVRDRAGVWRVLEITLGYTLSAYAECVFFNGSDLSPTKNRGSDQWKVLCDEIDHGAFL